MAKTKTVTYECRRCGTEIVVTSIGTGELSPLYCCGVETTETAPTAAGKMGRKKKTETNRSRPASARKKGRSARKKTQI